MLFKDGRMPQPARVGDGMCSHFAPKVFNAEADATLTVAELAGGLIFQGLTLTSDVVYTLPTSALLLAAHNMDTMDNGDSLSFVVTNSQAAAFDVVIAVGVGQTAIGTNNSLSVPPQSSRIFTLIKTSDTTFDLY